MNEFVVLSVANPWNQINLQDGMSQNDSHDSEHT